MGERQNFYSLQLPEPGHIPSPRDSGLTGLFIISLAFFVFGLCGLPFFCVCVLSGSPCAGKETPKKGGGEKIHRVRCLLLLPQKGWTRRDPFFLLLLSVSLNPLSPLSWWRVTARSWVFFLGGWLSPPPPPHPSTFPPYGQAAEQRLGREGKQREANQPTPPSPAEEGS